MPDATINHTPAGWPYLDEQNYIDVIDDYTTELATKLQNGEAAIARAENAATRAETAATRAENSTTVTAAATGQSTGTTTDTSHSRTITFPPGRFTAPPIVTLTPYGSSGQERLWCYRVTGTTNTGFTLWLLPNPGGNVVAGAAINVNWIAVQA